MSKKQSKSVTVTVDVPSTFAMLRSRLLSGVKAEGAPGALDVLATTRAFVLNLVLSYRAAIDAGQREFPVAEDFNALVGELVDTLTSDEGRKKDVRQMVTGGRYWALNLLSPSQARREQAEASRERQQGKKKVKAESKAEGEKAAVDRDAQMIALSVTNARKRGVAVDAIVAALDAL